MKSKKKQEIKKAKDIADRALRHASIVSLLLAMAKLVGFAFSGSLMLLASFFDSLSDSAMSYANRWIQRISKQAPDREHPFGHGGFQVVGCLIQGLIIVGFAAFLIVESVNRLRSDDPGAQMDFANLPLGIFILAVSAAAGLGLDRYLKLRLAELNRNFSRSLSLLADRAHYNGDAKMNAASAIGLLTVWWTGKAWLDAALGLVGAYFLLRAAFPLLLQVYRDIVHTEASPDLQQQIVAQAKSADDRVQSVHRLRTRELGPLLFVDFHMTLPSELKLDEAHEISERAVRAIRKLIPRADVMIHLDPDSEPDDDFWEPHPITSEQPVEIKA